MSNYMLALAGVTLIIVLAFTLSGSSEFKDTENVKPKKEIIRCIGGVQYYYFHERDEYNGYGYFGAAFNKDGTIKTCN